MNENEIGKEVVEVAVKLGLALNFGSSLMKQGMQRVINGLAEENLGVVAALRETQIEAEPDTE